MNVVGLIVEYNPLHYGHQYHFEQALRVTQADAVVIVMSGNFLQRGEPALVNKWARAQMALEMGADLIFELPYVYATQQASYFAYGAVSILDQLPFVTHLCFGSESGHLEELNYLAKLLVDEPESFQEQLQREMKKGTSYPHAYSKALQALLLDQEIDNKLLQLPNNILGLYYLIALKKLQSQIRPTTIKREKAGYHEREFVDERIASATSIRQALFSSASINWESIQAYVPLYTLEILRQEQAAGRGPVSWEHYFPYVLHSFLAQSTHHLQQIYEMEEGIEYRFKAKVQEAQTIEELCHLVKTKRYTWNRIQRMILHSFTQFTKEEAQRLGLGLTSPYLRLLGYSSKGRALLNQYKPALRSPLVSSIRKEHPPMMTWDLKASWLHSLAYQEQARQAQYKRELQQAPLFKQTT